MQSPTFRRRLQYGFLQQKRFYDEQCAPLFRTLHPNTLDWVLGPKLSRLARNGQGEVYPSMRAALDGHNAEYMAKHHTAVGNDRNILANLSCAAAANAATISFPSEAQSPSTSKKKTQSNKRSGSSSKKKASKTSSSNETSSTTLTVSELIGTNHAPISSTATRDNSGGISTAVSSSSILEPPSSAMSISSLPPAGDDPHLLMSGLRWLSTAQQRLEESRLKSFTHQNYAFEIGDVVYQKQLGQLGVVADRLPVCFESDEWIQEQLSSTADVRLKHPWYFILVASHRDLPVDMTRYGSALSHTKANKKLSIGFHSLLPVYFEGYDSERGVYIPRKDRAVFAKQHNHHVAKAQQISISSIMGHIQPKTAEEES